MLLLELISDRAQGCRMKFVGLITSVPAFRMRYPRP